MKKRNILKRYKEVEYFDEKLSLDWSINKRQQCRACGLNQNDIKCPRIKKESVLDNFRRYCDVKSVVYIKRKNIPIHAIHSVLLTQEEVQDWGNIKLKKARIRLKELTFVERYGTILHFEPTSIDLQNFIVLTNESRRRVGIKDPQLKITNAVFSEKTTQQNRVDAMAFANAAAKSMNTLRNVKFTNGLESD